VAGEADALAVVATWVLVELGVDDIETGRFAVFSEVLSLGESSLEEFSLFSTVSIYMCFLPRAEIRGSGDTGRGDSLCRALLSAGLKVACRSKSRRDTERGRA